MASGVACGWMEDERTIDDGALRRRLRCRLCCRFCGGLGCVQRAAVVDGGDKGTLGHEETDVRRPQRVVEQPLLGQRHRACEHVRRYRSRVNDCPRSNALDGLIHKARAVCPNRAAVGVAVLAVAIGRQRAHAVSRDGQAILAADDAELIFQVAKRGSKSGAADLAAQLVAPAARRRDRADKVVDQVVQPLDIQHLFCQRSVRHERQCEMRPIIMLINQEARTPNMRGVRGVWGGSGPVCCSAVGGGGLVVVRDIP